MLICSDFSYYGHLKNKEVLDKNGVLIGKNVTDLAFSPSLEVSHFIIGGGLLEEILEGLHLKEDVDPIIDISSIEQTDEKITLSVDKSEIGELIKGCCIPDEHLLLSELEDMDVVDNTGEKVGSVEDVAIYEEGCTSLIVCGSSFKKYLEKFGVIPDVHLVVPSTTVSGIKDNKITLNISRDQLDKIIKEDVTIESNLKRVGFQDKRKKVGLVGHQSLLQALPYKYKEQ
ncbi:MAG: PRC-barrel domain-containing protein [Candidatus Hodarchaeales archaeon]|jgi:sporulation protein YlmC with PRC-barrel domain